MLLLRGFSWDLIWLQALASNLCCAFCSVGSQEASGEHGWCPEQEHSTGESGVRGTGLGCLQLADAQGRTCSSGLGTSCTELTDCQLCSHEKEACSSSRILCEWEPATHHQVDMASRGRGCGSQPPGWETLGKTASLSLTLLSQGHGLRIKPTSWVTGRNQWR